MWGVFFTVFQEYSTQKLGVKRWEEFRDKVGLPNFVVPLVDYPDQALTSLIQETARASGRMDYDVEQEFGRFMVPELVKLYAYYFTRYSGTREFLLGMDEVHQQTERLQKGTAPPRFEYETPTPGTLVVRYRSERRLCSLLMGLMEGVADYYHEPVRLQSLACMKNGAPACRIRVDCGTKLGRQSRL